MGFKIEIEIQEERVENCIVSALTSRINGIGYWADVMLVEGRARDAYALVRESASARQGEAGQWLELDKEKIAVGLVRLAEYHPESFGAILSDDGDGPTGDLLIQLALLGEVRYG